MAAGDDSEGPYLEQHPINNDARFNPLFVTGDPEWRDYTVEVSVQPLSLEQEAGLAVRYRTSRHYYRVALEQGTHLRIAARLPIDRQFRVSAWRLVAEAPFNYDTKTWYRLSVSVEGDRLRAAIDGRELLDVKDSELAAGIAGISSNMPARFRDFHVPTTAAAAAAIRARTSKREDELRRLRAQNPAAKVVEEISRQLGTALGGTFALGIWTVMAGWTCSSRKTFRRSGATRSTISAASRRRRLTAKCFGFDGQLRRVVMFPDDGHPDLAAAVHDLTGDARDEIVLWDETRVGIYMQDRPFKGTRIYKPVRNPTYNDSNYRASVSLPGWSEVAARR